MSAGRGRAAGLLPSGGAALPYVASILLADLGQSPDRLTARLSERLRRSFPVPAEQTVLWAEVETGTRPHGVVLTDAGVFLKDGLPLDDDDDEGPQGPGGIESDGLGYLYARWESFDPAQVSHLQGRPTLDGQPFLDGAVFKRFAMACVRASNARVLARNAARRALRGTGLLPRGGPVRSVCRASAAMTCAYCFGEDGAYRFQEPDGAPRAVEVPRDQYDAVLQRMRRKVAEGAVPHLDAPGVADPRDPALAAALVACGWYTRAQAANIARTGRVAGVELRERTGSVVCTAPEGLGSRLAAWLSGRESLGPGAPGAAAVPLAGSDGALGQAMAAGARARSDAAKDPRRLQQEEVGRAVAANAASQASFAVGAAGARAVMAALGVASGPLAMAAGMLLGDAAGKAGVEAVSMVRDMFVEPRSRVLGRLFTGVMSNVVFEHALTGGEQDLLGELMRRAGPEVFQRLGAQVEGSASQEADVRALLEPMVAAVRRA